MQESSSGSRVKGFKDLQRQITDPDLCCGCGSCAGICPSDAIQIDFNAAGEYWPTVDEGRCSGCGLCVHACPFVSENPDMDELSGQIFVNDSAASHRRETGYLHRCFVGYAPQEELRWNGASGGLLTWVGCELLKRGEIDYLITVLSTGEPARLFEYSVLSRPDQVTGCSKSVYYPVEMSAVIKVIQKQEGRYAIVGLPCFVKALRQLQQISPIIKSRLKYIFGLVCGKNKSKLYTDVLTNRLGFRRDEIKTVCYRDKNGTEKSGDFYFTAENDKKQGRLLWSRGVNKIFCQPWFDLPPCRICDDIFAEGADAAFMDAWLPEFRSEIRGTSLVVSRNGRLSELLDEACRDVDIESVIRSQWGVVLRKRFLLDWKLARIGQEGRNHLSLIEKNPLKEAVARLRFHRSTTEADRLRRMDGAKQVELFKPHFRRWQTEERIYDSAMKLLQIPDRALRWRARTPRRVTNKILIAHIPNTLNYGSAMMAINLISGLRKRLGGGTEIYCDCDDYNLARLKEATGDENLKTFTVAVPPASVGMLRKASNLLFGKNPFVKTVTDSFDAMIVLGGDDLSETYMKSAVSKGLIYREINKSCKVILAGQSFGPFTGVSKLVSKWIYKDILIITREDNSYSFTKNILGIKSVFKSRDLAIGELPNQKYWRNLVKDKLPQNYIAVVPSGLSKKYTGSRDQYLMTWQKIVELLAERNKESKIILTAHVLKPEHANDATVINEIFDRLPADVKTRTECMTRPMQPAEARAVLGGAKYVLTGRMHAAVSAFHEGKPALSLAYSEKFSGVIGRGFELPQLIIDCRHRNWGPDSTILPEIADRISYIESEYDHLLSTITMNVERCRAMVKKQIDFIAASVFQECSSSAGLKKFQEMSLR